MKACENVIVTVRIFEKQLDMELPSFLPIGELKDKILETYYVMNQVQPGRGRDVLLSYEDQILDRARSLSYYGIWDGSFIDCIEGD